LLICTAGASLLPLLLLPLTAGREIGSSGVPDVPAAVWLLLPLSPLPEELLGSSMRFTPHMSSESMNLQQCIKMKLSNRQLLTLTLVPHKVISHQGCDMYGSHFTNARTCP
jgi:hypothetical protein